MLWLGRQTPLQGKINIVHHPHFWPPKLPVFRRQPVQASSVCQMGGLGHEVTRPDRLVGSQGAYAKKHWSVRVNQQLPHSLSVPQADTLSGENGVAPCLAVCTAEAESRSTCSLCSACLLQGCTRQVHA